MSGFTRQHFARAGFPVYESANVVGTPQSVSGTTGLTVNKPTGTTTGDLIVLAGATRNASLAEPGAGGGAAWTQVGYYDADTSEWVGLWYKVADGSEPSTYTATMGGGGGGVLAICTFRFPHTPVITNGIVMDERWANGLGAPAGTRGGLVIYAGIGNYLGTAMAVPSDLTYITSHIFIQQGSDAQVLIASYPAGEEGPVRRMGYTGGSTTSYRHLGYIIVKGTPA